MSKTNCCNCGAALNIFAPKCEFCGTKNVNITDIDLASGEAANFIFKLPNNFKDNYGNEIYLSVLAVPELQTMEMESESAIAYGGYTNSPLFQTSINSSFNLGLKLHAVSSK